MIVPMVRVTVVGAREDKAAILAALQDLGCLHLIPLRPAAAALSAEGPAAATREALRYLLDCPQRRHQTRDASRFEAARVEARALAIKRRVEELSDERDALQVRIADLTPWGDFDLPPEGELGEVKLWFYIVPHNQMKKVAAVNLPWKEVARDNRFRYVAVLAAAEPRGMPVPRTHTGTRSLRALRGRLEEVETEMEDLQAERSALTRWCTLFARSVFAAEDAAALAQAESTTLDDDRLFGLSAWAPRSSADALRDFAREHGLVLEIAEPGPGETPPTALANAPALAGGEDLVSIYITPAYRLWDPSAAVFFSFSLFFAMILADAGYALLLALGLGLFWRRMGKTAGGRRWRVLLAAMFGAGLAYGVIVGGYFGVEPAAGSFLGKLVLLRPRDFDAMMKVTILAGVAQLTFANAVSAWRRRHGPAALGPVGWILIFLGGTCLWLGGASVRAAGKGLLGAGAIGVLLFTKTSAGWVHRLLGGLEGLTRLSAAFGDTLSYMRLFALGLAGCSLAAAFNGLAGQVKESVPGLGFLLALIIFLFGHALNLSLSIMGGFIHGLRLNCIEFFNWCLPEEGYPFRAFKRKEKEAWNS